MSHDPHFGFVVAAYALAFLVIGGMTGAVLIDSFRLKRALALLAPPAPEPRAPYGPASGEAPPPASNSGGTG